MPGVMTEIAISGVIGALSYALDIAEGQPPGHAVRSCLIGMRLAAEIDLSASDRSDLIYALLLKDAGCSANANRMSVLFAADDRAAKATSKLVDWTNPRAAFLWSLRTVAPGTGLRRRIEVLKGIRDEGEVTRKFMQARCERGGEIARMLFLSEQTAAAILSLDEHWVGRGMPDGLCGEEIPLAARILCLAQTIEVFHAAEGLKSARTMALRRRGRWFDPALVDAFLRFCGDRDSWDALESPDVSEWEPPDFALAGDDARLDRIAEAFARVIDAKSPFTARHSVRVSEIADGIAAELRFDADGRRTLRRASLLHDIGKLAISSRILDKPDKLTDEEFRAIQTHPAASAFPKRTWVTNSSGPAPLRAVRRLIHNLSGLRCCERSSSRRTGTSERVVVAIMLPPIRTKRGHPHAAPRPRKVGGRAATRARSARRPRPCRRRSPRRGESRR